MPSHRARSLVKIRRGLDIPLHGAPARRIDDGEKVTHAALIAGEYHDLRPDVKVAAGAEVRAGQTLFVDKKCPDVHYVAPVSGIVKAINRGARRVLKSVVVEIDESLPGTAYQSFSPDEVRKLSREQVVRHLLEAGLWPALRTRPYSKTPDPSTRPHSIFLTAMDTRPLAADPIFVIHRRPREFSVGIEVLCRLSEDKVFVCTAADCDLPLPKAEKVRHVRFDGPHPAGLVGTHIHFLDPVDGKKTVWTIGYQDVVAIGQLLVSGQWPAERVISLAGPSVRRPRLLRTLAGACVSELCRNECHDDGHRLVAGSVLEGWDARDGTDFLGRFSLQLTALPEQIDNRRTFGWLRPLPDMFSISRAVSWLPFQSKRLSFDCRVNGSPRAFVPLGLYERVMPLELLPTQLLRSILVMDTEMAQKLGCLELDEEDLALCSYVCPSKHDFGEALRAVLTQIEKEG